MQMNVLKLEKLSKYAPTSSKVVECFNGPTPAYFSFIFGLFKQTIQF